MSQPLPLNVSYGTIRGRFGIAVTAANDADHLPNFVPLQGLLITFTATVPYVFDSTAAPNPSTIVLAPIVCTIDPTTGYLLDPTGAEGVNLIATDDPDLLPTGTWGYKVDYSGAATAAGLPSHYIDMPAGSTRWLTSIAPVPQTDGVSLTQLTLESHVVLMKTQIDATALMLTPLAASAAVLAQAAGSALQSETAAAASKNAAAISATNAGASATAATASATPPAAAASVLTRGLVITATNVTTIPAGGTVDNLAAYYNSGTTPVTVAGVVLAAAAQAVWAWVSGAWVLLSSGASSPSNTVAPVWTATLTTGTPSSTSVVVAASALATDDIAVTGYRWRLTGEATSVARVITPSGLNFTLTGLTASTIYTAPIFWAVDGSGNKSAELTAQGFTTPVPPPEWKTVFLDTFTEADGTLLNNHIPDIGPKWTLPASIPPLCATIYSGKAQLFHQTGIGNWPGMSAQLALPFTTRKLRFTFDYHIGASAGSKHSIQLFKNHIVSWSSDTVMIFSINQTGTFTFTLGPNVDRTSLLVGSTAFPASGTAVVEVTDSTLTVSVGGTLLRSIDFTGDSAQHFWTAAPVTDIYMNLSGADTSVVGTKSTMTTDNVRVEQFV